MDSQEIHTTNIKALYESTIHYLILKLWSNYLS